MRKTYRGLVKTRKEIDVIAEENHLGNFYLRGDVDGTKFGRLHRYDLRLCGKFIHYHFGDFDENVYVYVLEDDEWGWPKWAIDDVPETNFDKI